jgi:hypothetical protein
MTSAIVACPVRSPIRSASASDFSGCNLGSRKVALDLDA